MHRVTAIPHSQATPRAARWVEDGKADGEREGFGARKSAEAVAKATARSDDAAPDLRSRKMRPDEAQRAEPNPVYDANSYRIARATGLPGYGTTRDFEYDASGNLVIDRARKLVFLNDNRGLAETIHYYENGVPSTFTAQDAEKHQLPPTTATEVVRMAYDEGGNRIYREILRPGQPPVSQEVTLAGKAVFRRDVGTASWQLKFLMGIDGRYETAGQEFFVMKDHQGSVRAVADATGRIVGADDYLPYGKAKPLHVSSQAGNPPWKWQGKELDADGQYEFYYFGARYWNPDLGIWLTPDPAGQFANPYGYGGDPVNYTDPDGRCIDGVSTVFCAMAVGAAVGAVAGGATYSAVAIANDNWTLDGFSKSVGMGAVGGAVSGGVGSLGTSLATNIAYGTLGNMTSYTATSYMFGGHGPTMAGYAGAIVGGIAGGFIPGYEGTAGDAWSNAFGEIGYSTIKGAAVGSLSGGVGASIQQGDIGAFGDGALLGAKQGAVGGAIGAVTRIELFGETRQNTYDTEERLDRVGKFWYEETGNYRSVTRNGGSLGWIGQKMGLFGGISIGRNSLDPTGQHELHENIHYLQQIEQGWVQFYINAAHEQWFWNGSQSPYTTWGTNEYWAEYWSRY